MDESAALMTVSDLAVYLNLKPETIRNLTRKGEIPSVRVGKRLIRFKRSEIEAWLEKNSNRNARRPS